MLPLNSIGATVDEAVFKLPFTPGLIQYPTSPLVVDCSIYEYDEQPPQLPAALTFILLKVNISNKVIKENYFEHLGNSLEEENKKISELSNIMCLNSEKDKYTKAE